MDTFSPQIYANYPVLDSVLMYYLDIEGIVQRHQVNPLTFQTWESLNLLAQRFNLPPSLTFQAFLDLYDAMYPTVRSYFLLGANPKAIILRAAEAGNLQAFYLGLRRNPQYKNPKLLDRALRRAARGGHQVMIDLIKDLGGTSFNEEVTGTAEGGHLEKLKLLIAQGNRLSRVLLFQLTNYAVKFGQLATFKYLITLWAPGTEYWNGLSFSAGESGNQSIIDYVISHYGDNYTHVILGAIYGGRLDLAIQYMEKPGLNYLDIFSQAIDYNYLDLAKLAARGQRIDQDVLNGLMEYYEPTTTYQIIDYLISLGGDNYDGLVSRIVINDDIELFKRYYLSPGLDYLETFYEGLGNSSLKIVKFMLLQQLVPVTEKELNRYLEHVGLNPELIDLLFRLGATNYRTIVEKALIDGNLELAEKYFNRATGLRLNKVFKQCNKIPVYQYIMSQGRIKQKTVDATLARLTLYKHKYVEEKKYLTSLSLQDGSSSSSSD